MIKKITLLLSALCVFLLLSTANANATEKDLHCKDEKSVKLFGHNFLCSKVKALLKSISVGSEHDPLINLYVFDSSSLLEGSKSLGLIANQYGSLVMAFYSFDSPENKFDEIKKLLEGKYGDFKKADPMRPFSTNTPEYIANHQWEKVINDVEIKLVGEDKKTFKLTYTAINRSDSYKKWYRSVMNKEKERLQKEKAKKQNEAF